MERLLIIILFTATIHMVDTLSYSVRLAGIRTKRLAMAISLFNIIVLISRTANMVQAPLLGSIVDRAIIEGSAGLLLGDFRWIIFSATMGSILGAVLIPSFVEIFSRGIIKLEQAGSIPQLLGQIYFQRPLGKIRKSLKRPSLSLLRGLRLEKIPPTFLILNLIITSISTIGVLAAIYAGALVPRYRITASQLSGIINGAATILLAIVVDPQAAIITDQTLQGLRERQEANTMVAFLVGGKILGTVLSQLIFLKAAEFVVLITKLIV
ncbi:lipid II flippase Amj family protein [Thermoanaerobacterium sp. DL9XJH110]|uniref:lipid II flippase Amj family protein n=1 Tax=Thermoanaerobacterium sp. DL9XJH110 TaxID=3386643 RepID=UPI003BB5BA77